MPESRDKTRAKAILLAAIRGTGCFEGRTKLHKVFYYAHLLYLHRHGRLLSSHPIIKMPEGPFIWHSRRLLGELVKEGLIREGKQRKGRREEHTFVIVDNEAADRAIAAELSQEAVSVVAESSRKFRDWSGSGASNWSHNVSRAWHLEGKGDELDIYMDYWDQDDFESIERDLESDSETIRDILGLDED